MIDKGKKNKFLFAASIAICFVTVLIYEFMTPMMMDDMTYLREVKGADSFFDLFLQERAQYLGWTGRSVAHIMMRMLMFADLHVLGGGRLLFNIVASAAFTGLTLLIYANVRKRQRHDVHVYMLIVLLIWIFGVDFSETVLWETGACNYLLTTTIIMSFLTCYRFSIRDYVNGSLNEKTAGLRAVLLLLLGICAGWCNENTSGGLMLFTLLISAETIRGGKKITPWMISGILGNAIGLAFMILAPGNALRASQREELHGGLLGMAARFLNVTNALYELFFVLIAALIVLIVYLRSSGKKAGELKEVIIFAGLFVITSYSLILTVTPQNRAFFGAGIFLILAVVQGYADAEDGVLWTRVLRKSMVYILCMYMIFTYLSSGASLARIYREEQERYAYLEELSKTGQEDAAVPMLRPDFKTKYSAAYDCDITEAWQNWTNVMMAEYYGFKVLVGVDRETWTEY